MNNSASAEKILKMYEMMYRIRKFEEKVYLLFLEGIMPGTIHQSHGQEACAVGVIYNLKSSDYVLSTHRPVGHALAKGISPKSIMAEMFGKITGCSRGKGGAMHLCDTSLGFLPSNAIVGGNLPIAVGVGLSCKMQKKDNVVVCFFGDGANNEGSFHESVNAAAIWNLPIVFVCENNLYAASTRYDKTMKLKNIADRACAYGIPGEVADGNDVLEVEKVAKSAIERARQGKGSTLLELKTYRIGGHSRNDACNYRNKEEQKEWFSKDPIKKLKNYILENNLSNEESLNKIEKKIIDEIDEAVRYAEESEFPEPENALMDVYSGEVE